MSTPHSIQAGESASSPEQVHVVEESEGSSEVRPKGFRGERAGAPQEWGTESQATMENKIRFKSRTSSKVSTTFASTILLHHL